MNRRILIIASTLAVAASGVGAGALAQEAAEAPHPAHIHVGLCPTPGDVVQPLADVAPPAGPAMGMASAIPVEISITENIAMPLADILAGEHSINIHQSADAMDVYIACGDIGGLDISPTDLAIGLGEQNDSDHLGVARLHDNGDGTTNVTVYLVREDDVDDDDDDGSSPAPGGSPAPTSSPDDDDDDEESPSP